MLQAVVLALVQGIAAFLPVSALVHKRVLSVFLGFEPASLGLEAALELGCLLAAALFFAFDWFIMLTGVAGFRIGRDPELHRSRGMLLMLLAATVPAAIAGYWFAPFNKSFANPYLAGLLLIVVGVAMSWAEGGAHRQKALDHLSFVDAMFIGLLQALAVLPGASRMAVTLTAAMLLNFERQAAVRISYLLSLPILAGRTWMAVRALSAAGGLKEGSLAPFVAAALISALAACATIALFLEYAGQGSLRPLARYRMGLGVVVLVLAVAMN